MDFVGKMKRMNDQGILDVIIAKTAGKAISVTLWRTASEETVTDQSSGRDRVLHNQKDRNVEIVTDHTKEMDLHLDLRLKA